ncbi:hypothetical protein F0562_010936 [Nyssa sinensis]|uniref:Integrase catalytic domain-containing protein n=1 Tax=Nyssa sinensis TaxID=561372 RepID=A0A5J5A0G6_9ASTE|nr:hypothetical protein F0562_010936 [Nyssa sinensis]
MGSAYHPQTDGQSEVVNRCIEGYLRCLIGDKPTVLTKWLPLAKWWYNTTYHVTNGVTPYEALYGQPPPTLKHYVPGDTTVAAADTMLRDRDAILKLLKEHLVQSQQRMKQQADKHRSERVFVVGDWVYLKLQPFKQVSLALIKNAKLAPKYFVFHVSLLKPKLGQSTVVQPSLPPTSPDGQLQLEPIAILDRKLIKKHDRPFTMVLVQWSNSIPEDATWESWHSLQQRFPHFKP